jgi:mRNA interferase MazF
VPQRGDFVWLDFSPHAGHEQAGRRPALVLSAGAFNAATGLLFACPITSRHRGLPLEVVLPDGLAVRGSLLAHHTRSVDWRSRRAEVIAPAPAGVLTAVLEVVRPLLFLD